MKYKAAMRVSLQFFFILIFILLKSNSTNAHEFWMEPDKYFANQSDTIEISNRIGQNFIGDTWPYISNSFFSFEYVLNKTSVRIVGLEGDDPAAKLKINSAGLVIVTQHTKGDEVTFEKWKKFKEYLKNEGLADKIDEHLRQNLPKQDIKEKYYRCAKLLLNIQSSSEDFDHFTGMPLEIVTAKNPYHLEPNEQLQVQVLYYGEPLPNAQIIKISKNSGTRLFGPRTNADGKALLTLTESGPILLSVVHLTAAPKRSNVHWISHWASLTFSKI